MKKVALATLLSLFLATVAVIAFPGSVRAADGCIITVNGTITSTSNASAPIASPSMTDGDTSVYPISICGDIAKGQDIVGVGGKVVSATNYWGDTRWQYSSLTLSGTCFNGEIRKTGVGDPHGHTISIEQDGNSSVKICDARYIQLKKAEVTCGGLNERCCSSSDPSQPSPITCRSGFPSSENWSSPDCKCAATKACKNMTCPPGFKRDGCPLIGEGVKACCNEEETKFADEICGDDTAITAASFDLCKQATGATEQAKCRDCIGKKTIPGKEGLWTAVGCVPTDAQGIVESFLRIGLGLSGGFVLLSILAGAFMFATSAGDAKKVQEAKEMVSSAIIGLLFVIFSVIILRFIVISVLRIPGFGS